MLGLLKWNKNRMDIELRIYRQNKTRKEVEKEEEDMEQIVIPRSSTYTITNKQK